MSVNSRSEFFADRIRRIHRDQITLDIGRVENICRAVAVDVGMQDHFRVGFDCHPRFIALDDRRVIDRELAVAVDVAAYGQDNICVCRNIKTHTEILYFKGQPAVFIDRLQIFHFAVLVSVYLRVGL